MIPVAASIPIEGIDEQQIHNSFIGDIERNSVFVLLLISCRFCASLLQIISSIISFNSSIIGADQTDVFWPRMASTDSGG